MMSFKPLNALRFSFYNPFTFHEHLKSILNHTQRLKAKRLRESKERAKWSSQFSDKPAPKLWSFRINTKGTPVLTIRKRDPRYLYQSELKELLEKNSPYKTSILRLIDTKKIEIRENPPEAE